VILRRLSQSLKEQNWTAIVIEFVLLVTGVFLGTEVSSWNQEREQRNKAQIFSTRLREDMRHELWSEQLLIEYYKQVRKNAEQALDALYGRKPLDDEAFLISAYRATQYRFNDRARATYDELVSTGTIGLIADRDLRRTAIITFTTTLFDDVTRKAQESEYRALFRESVAFEVQRALLEKCGDREVSSLDYAGLAHQLDYPCALGLPGAGIHQAAEALRAKTRMIPSLQLRYADLGTAIDDLGKDRQDKVSPR
jgi:hypothetical protein